MLFRWLCEAMSADKSSTIYDSLPPQISGQKLGQIHVRFPKIVRNDGKPNVGFRVKFIWWGQKSEPCVLTVPWKPGQVVNDAIFPVRVDRGSLEGYFSDMETIYFSIYDSEGNLFGVATLPLIRLSNNNLGFDGVLPIKGVGQSKNQVVAELHTHIITTYDAMRRKLAKEILENKRTTNVDVFQRMEALVVTDTAERFSDWPKSDGIKAANNFQPIERKVSEKSLQESGPRKPLTRADNDPESSKTIPLLARRAAARRRAAGLPARNTAPVYTGPLPNNRSDIDAESVSLAHTTETNQPMGGVAVTFAQESLKPLGPQPAHAPDETKVHHDQRMSTTTQENHTVRPTPSEMLTRAQSLLSRVKGAISENHRRSEQKSEQYAVDRESVMLGKEVVDSINDWASALTRAHTGPQGGRVLSGIGNRKWPGESSSLSPSKVNEVEWMLRGVPEVFDDDAYIEDEVVEKLIQQGGLPPSQIAFPSLYEASQRTLSSLRDIKKMQLTITGLMIASARCGLRRHGSYMVIHCPSGCKSLTGQPDSRKITVDIPDHHVGKGPDVGKHKNVMKDYFVGQVPLNISIDWNVLLTDGVLKDWLHPNTSRVNGVIHIEFYSYLSPPLQSDPVSNRSRIPSKGKLEDKHTTTSLKPVWTSPAMLLGFADIPLDNMLGTTALQVHVTSDIVMDKASQATIADRLERLPTGVSLRTAKPLGDSLGNITCTLALLPDEKMPNEFTNTKESREDGSKIYHKTLQDPSRVEIYPDTNHHTQLRTVIDDALDFVPTDTFIPHDQSYALRPGALSGLSNQDDTNRPTYVGIALHFITVALDDTALAHLRLPIRNEPVKIVLSYKIALSNGSIRDEVDAVIPAHKFSSSASFEVELSAGRIHSIEDMMSWRFVYFEVWLRWHGVVHPQTDESKFLGLAKFPVHTNIGEPVTLSIIDPSTGRSYGHIDTTVQFHHRGTSNEAEKLLEKCLTSESVRRMLRMDHQHSMSTKLPKTSDMSNKSNSKSRGTIDATAGSKTNVLTTSYPPKSASRTGNVQAQDQALASEKSPPSSPLKAPSTGEEDRSASSVLQPVALPKVSEEPDLTFSLRTSAQKSANGSITSFKGSLRFSSDSLMGDFLRMSGRNATASKATEYVANSVDSLEVAQSTPEGVGESVDGDKEVYPHEQEVDNNVDEYQPEPLHLESKTIADLAGASEHILDVSVLDGFGDVWNQYSHIFHHGRDIPLGCFVCYRFPGIISDHVESWNSVRLVRSGQYEGWLCVWWDADCSILNSRNRHKFEVHDGTLPLARLGLNDSSSNFMEIVLLPSDPDGNMPLTPYCMGRAQLPLSALGAILDRAGFSQTLTLSIALEGISRVTAEAPNLKLVLSHRIVPGSIHKRNVDAPPLERSRIDVVAETPISSDPIQTLLVTGAHAHRESKPVPHSLVVKIDRIVHLPEHEYSSGEKNVYLTCSMKNVATDRALYDPVHSKFNSSLKHIQESVIWNEVHTLSPTISSQSALGFASPTSLYRSCHLAVTLYSRPEWKLPKSVRPSDPQRLQIGDISIASATVDLSTLASGFPYIEGWYHLLDDNQRCIGQIKLSVFRQGSEVLPSDLYDYVDAALEVSGVLEERKSDDRSEAALSSAMQNVPEESGDEEMESMSTQLRNMIHILDLSTNALMKRGRFDVDSTDKPDELIGIGNKGDKDDSIVRSDMSDSLKGDDWETDEEDARIKVDPGHGDHRHDNSIDDLILEDMDMDSKVDNDDWKQDEEGEEDQSRGSRCDEYKAPDNQREYGYGSEDERRSAGDEGKHRGDEDDFDIADDTHNRYFDTDSDRDSRANMSASLEEFPLDFALEDEHDDAADSSRPFLSEDDPGTASHETSLNEDNNSEFSRDNVEHVIEEEKLDVGSRLSGDESSDSEYLDEPFEVYDPIGTGQSEYPSYCDLDVVNEDEVDVASDGSVTGSDNGEGVDDDVRSAVTVESMLRESLSVACQTDLLEDNRDIEDNWACENRDEDEMTGDQSRDHLMDSSNYTFEGGALTISQKSSPWMDDERRDGSGVEDSSSPFDMDTKKSNQHQQIDIFESVSLIHLLPERRKESLKSSHTHDTDSCSIINEMKTIADIVKSVMSEDGGRPAPWTVNPGRRRKFVDAETDRISKAMMKSIKGCDSY